MTMDANWVCHVILVILLQTTCNNILGAYWANGHGISAHVCIIPWQPKISITQFNIMAKNIQYVFKKLVEHYEKLCPP
jgi:hypothetical protein